jgi:hypothetical protein
MPPPAEDSACFRACPASLRSLFELTSLPFLGLGPMEICTGSAAPREAAAAGRCFTGAAIRLCLEL